jgi:hypothetical protein
MQKILIFLILALCFPILATCPEGEWPFFAITKAREVTLCLKAIPKTAPDSYEIQITAILKEGHLSKKLKMLSLIEVGPRKTIFPASFILASETDTDPVPLIMSFTILKNQVVKLHIGNNSWEKNGDELAQECEAIGPMVIKDVLARIISKAQKQNKI